MVVYAHGNSQSLETKFAKAPKLIIDIIYIAWNIINVLYLFNQWVIYFKLTCNQHFTLMLLLKFAKYSLYIKIIKKLLYIDFIVESPLYQSRLLYFQLNSPWCLQRCNMYEYSQRTNTIMRAICLTKAKIARDVWTYIISQ